MDRIPDHHDAELILKLYDLRREPVMRENRSRFLKEFWPRTAAEMVAVTKSDHPLNVSYRQVTTFWEMAYMLCRYDTLSVDMLLESSTEGLYAFARIEPYLAELRAATNPRTLRNTEWIANHTELARAIMETQRGRLKAMLAQRK